MTVPDRTPVLELSVRPVGREPEETLHVMGGLPDAVNVWLYATPYMAGVGETEVMVGGAPPVGRTIPRVKSWRIFCCLDGIPHPVYGCFTLKYT